MGTDEPTFPYPSSKNLMYAIGDLKEQIAKTTDRIELLEQHNALVRELAALKEKENFLEKDPHNTTKGDEEKKSKKKSGSASAKPVCYESRYSSASRA